MVLIKKGPIHTSLPLLQEALAQSEAQTQAQSQSRPQVELVPRLCHLVRSEMGYGFNLHSDRSRPGQYIRSLDPGSPADRAGLQPQDRLIEVGRKSADDGSLRSEGVKRGEKPDDGMQSNTIVLQ